MKKRSRIIFALLLVLALLLGLLLLIGGENEEDATDPVPTIEKDSITAIEWSNSGEEIRLEKREGTWYWAEDDIFPVDQLISGDLATTLSSLRTNAHIPKEEVVNEEDYGLHYPIRTLAVEGRDGTRYEYEVGNQSTLNSSYFYVRVNGEDVYLVNEAIYNDFEKALYDIIEEDDIPSFTNISSVTFETADSTSVYTRTEDGEGWLRSINGDESAEVDTDETNALIKKITGLKWAYCVHYSPGEEEKAEYGTEKPSCTVTVISEGAGGEESEFVLLIGNDAGDYSYAKLSSSDMVYLIDGETADAFKSADK